MATGALSDRDLALKSVRLRKRTLEIIYHAGAGHTGGSLSCLDILNLLYNRILNVSPETFGEPTRDRYVQSKGHSVEALYAVLADCGFFPNSKLETLCHYQSPFVGHPTRKIPGIEMNTGALGHGLSISVGMALAGKMDGAPYRVFTLMGDGELAEGSNWEAAMAAAHYDLDNLTAIIDHNTLQITGPTRDVCSNEPLDEKWRAFGWTVATVNGHDFAALTEALSKPAEPGKPTCIIANTVKGRGVSFIENTTQWHHRVPTESEFQQAMRELDVAEAKLKEAAE
ncbi:MAG TPA: transketolase [Verrucomicrobiae bacterium]|nr:transketolase [Verrucomicrobiae bacterium]